MSKNREERANYYLYIDGQAVPVSEQIYRVYQHYERKEEYFSYDLKTEKFQKDTASFLPSREDSYERLLEKDQQFAASGQPVEEQAVSSVWLAGRSFLHLVQHFFHGLLQHPSGKPGGLHTEGNGALGDFFLHE